MEHHSTAQVANLFKVNPQTVRRWTEDFKVHFSSLAADLQVAAIIGQLRKQQAPNEDIHAALANRNPEQPIRLPDFDALVVATGANKTNLQMALVTEQLEVMKTQVIKLNAIVEERDNNLAKADKKIEDLQQERIDLNRQIARLEGKLESLEGKE